MIQSLRDQLRELEKEDGQLQSANGNNHSLVNSPAAYRSPSVQHSLHISAESRIDRTTINEPLSQHYQVPEVPLPSSPFMSTGNPKASMDDLNPRLPMLQQLASSQSSFSLDDPEPSSLEKMMKPNSQVIDKRDQWSEISAPTREAYTESVKSWSDNDHTSSPCNCDHLLNTRQWSLPLRRRADSLVTRFFRKNNVTFPILHERTFRRQYVRLWHPDPAHGDTPLAVCSGLCKQRSQGRLFPATMYAVFALSCLFETKHLEQNATKADAFFRLLQKVDLLEILDNEAGLELIQLLLLIGIYLQSTERFSKCKNISGLAIRMAQNMGLHYNVDEAQERGLLPSSPTQLDCEIRARVWNACVILERY